MLQIEDVTVQFSGHTVLSRLSLDVQAGETVGIIGPNGSGKTTLFNCISGFVRASSGRISFRGTEISHWLPYRRALYGMGRVFQSFGIFREMTVEENLLMALESRESGWRTMVPWGNGRRRYAEEIERLLAQVGLSGRARERAGSLSGGQLRLLEIIRLVAFGAELMLLDEPTAGVSPKMKFEISALIARLRETGKTLLIIEHDLPFIERLCERVVVLDEGRVVLDGTPELVRADPKLQQIYFGAPDTVVR